MSAEILLSRFSLVPQHCNAVLWVWRRQSWRIKKWQIRPLSLTYMSRTRPSDRASAAKPHLSDAELGEPSEPEEASRSKSSKRGKRSFESFVRQLAALLSLSPSEPDLFGAILTEVAELARDERAQVGETERYMRESIAIKDRRIAELENTLKQSQKLCRTMETEIDQKLAANQDLKRTIDDHEQTIADLNTTIRQFMAACDVYESPERAVTAVHKMKQERNERERMASIELDSMFQRLSDSRKAGMDELSEQIRRQEYRIESAIETICQKVQADPNDTASIEIARTLESTNRLLAERMDQLRNLRVCQSDEEDDTRADARCARPESGGYDDEGLGPSIWMAKTRELLSLERQIRHMNHRLDHATRNCHFLAQENYRLHTARDSRQPTTAETLL
jgi:hypothetical protein